MSQLGLTRHPSKGEWVGSTSIEHLGVHIDSVQMKFFVAPRKAAKVRQLAAQLLRSVRHGKRWVTKRQLTHFCGLCVSLTLAMPWARFYTRPLYWDMSSGRRLDHRGRVRLSHQSIRDLLTWKGLSRRELLRRSMRPFVPTASMHTDGADVGFGGTLNTQDLTAGIDGQWQAQGVWTWEDRAESISYRELKAIRRLLTGCIWSELVSQGRKHLLLHVDNMAVVHITNAMVSASRPMMRELRRLKCVLDRQGFQIRSEWIPSVANRFADALSRRFPRGDFQIRQQLRQSVQAGMKAPIDVFPFRPTGEHPSYLQRQAYQELATQWSTDQAPLLCPPVQLISATVHKLRETRAPAILLIPDWPRQPWHSAALDLAQTAKRLEGPPQAMWTGHRKLNKEWRLSMLEVNLDA